MADTDTTKNPEITTLKRSDSKIVPPTAETDNTTASATAASTTVDTAAANPIAADPTAAVAAPTPAATGPNDCPEKFGISIEYMCADTSAATGGALSAIRKISLIYKKSDTTPVQTIPIVSVPFKKNEPVINNPNFKSFEEIYKPLFEAIKTNKDITYNGTFDANTNNMIGDIIIPNNNTLAGEINAKIAALRQSAQLHTGGGKSRRKIQKKRKNKRTKKHNK